MKNHSFISKILIFFTIFFVFMLPPVLQVTIKQDTFVEWNFSYSVLFTAISMSLLLYIYSDLIKIREDRISLFSKLACSLSSLCFLLIISVMINFLHIEGTEIAVQPPATFTSICICLINFLLSAFCEEVLYRFYAPEILFNILEKKIGKKAAFLISEVFVCVMFALGHRYAGIPAIINSILGYAILRMNIKKTTSITMNTLVHFIYNLIQLFC